MTTVIDFPLPFVTPFTPPPTYEPNAWHQWEVAPADAEPPATPETPVEAATRALWEAEQAVRLLMDVPARDLACVYSRVVTERGHGVLPASDQLAALIRQLVLVHNAVTGAA